MTHHDVLVVGAGNAGISLAARLQRDGCRDVALVEPSRVHRYRPLLSYVAGGAARLADLERPQEEALPPGCHWYPTSVTAVDPAGSTVDLADGRTLTYGDLAVCPGSEVDWDAVPGSAEALATPNASTSYLPEHAEEAWPMLSGLTAGTAVFVMSARHVPCAPVTLKPLFMAADHWRAAGVLDAIDIELLVEADRLVDHTGAERELRAAAERYGVRVRTSTTVEAVDPSRQTLRLRTDRGSAPGSRSGRGPHTDLDVATDTDVDSNVVTDADRADLGRESDELRYDVLFLAPPHRAPDWVAASGLSDERSGGFVAVDPLTLQHRTHPRVWGLGDAAAVDALPSGGALRKQVPVVAHNIAARRTGRTMQHYSGYSVAPVTTSRRRLLLAEFDRDGRPEPSLPFPDLTRPRLATLLFDRYLEPQVYWHRLLRGHV